VEVIQEVGSYAGFAAVVGLAVLSALYFSQARDLRRLREWAGRAPERAAEQAVQAPEQAAQQATRPPPSGAVKPIPAAKPAAAAAAAAAGAAPATSVQQGKPGTATAVKPPPQGQPPQPATPGQPPKPGAAPPAPATAAANAGQAAAPRAPAKAAEGDKPAAGDKPAIPGAPGAGLPATAAARPARPPAVAPPRPALPGRAPGAPAARPAGAAAQATAVLPASERLRRPQQAGRRGAGLEPRYLALIIAGVIVVGGAAAYGISQMGGDDGSPTADQEQPAQEQPTGPVNPSTVTVSVLNGTTVPGLAAQIGDELESAGFQRGNVANAIDQQRAESVVLHAEGADREARTVARKLGISQIEPVDPDSQALAGAASVVVIVGADRTQ